MKITNLQSTIVTPKKEDTALVINSLASSSDAVTQMSIELLVAFDGQPFKPYSDEKLRELAEDIRINGVLSPIIVRPIENGRYQILAGHNRTNASKLLGLTTIPAVIKPCDDITAMLIVVTTNLNQRQELFPSEKAFAYKMQLEAMKRRAGRPKENSDPVGPNYFGTTSVEALSQKSTDSTTQIKRYIRLTFLIKPFLEMVDYNKVSFQTGVNLSFLSESNQEVLHDFISEYTKAKINLKKSELLKELNEYEEFTSEMLFEIFFPSTDIDTAVENTEYNVKLNQTQHKALLACIKNNQQSFEPTIYKEIIKILGES